MHIAETPPRPDRDHATSPKGWGRRGRFIPAQLCLRCGAIVRRSVNPVPRWSGDAGRPSPGGDSRPCTTLTTGAGRPSASAGRRTPRPTSLSGRRPVSGSGQTAGGPSPGRSAWLGSSGSRAVIVAYQLARLSRPDEGPPSPSTRRRRRPIPRRPGAIASARATRLDPCRAPRDRRRSGPDRRYLVADRLVRGTVSPRIARLTSRAKPLTDREPCAPRPRERPIAPREPSPAVAATVSFAPAGRATVPERKCLFPTWD